MRHINVKDLRFADSVALYDDLKKIAENNDLKHNGEDAEYLDVKQYSFLVLSDIHLEVANSSDVSTSAGKRNSVNDFKNALQLAKQHSVDFACVIGDIGMEASSWSNTDSLYKRAILESKFDKSIYCVTGNHDQSVPEQNWKNTTGCDLTYAIPIENDLFVFLSLATKTGSDAKQTKPYSDDDVEFLAQTLRNNPKKNVFLFMHFPLNAMRPTNQYAGLQELYYPSSVSNYIDSSGNSVTGGANNTNSVHHYGFKLSFADGRWQNAQNQQILDILRAYDGRIIVFNGHTHYAFDVDMYSPNVIFSEIDDNVYAIHVPSTDYPRNRNDAALCNNVPNLQPSQGYIVERYNDKIVVNGYEFNQNVKKFNANRPMRKYSISLS